MQRDYSIHQTLKKEILITQIKVNYITASHIALSMLVNMKITTMIVAQNIDSLVMDGSIQLRLVAVSVAKQIN